jgi:aromatic-L-amino-acid decarboxylase
MLELEDFQKGSARICEWIARYYRDLESFPVKSQVRPGEVYGMIPAAAPAGPEPLEAILSDLDRVILPGITHWQHPNFHAYFTANASVESVFAEMITAAVGAQCMIWDTSPAAAELEQRMLEWFREAMDLPAGFEGVIQDTASSATLVAIITAREVKTGFKSNYEGVPSNLRVYCSQQTHSSIEKGVGISGIGKKNLVKVAVDGRQRMIPAEFEKHVQEDLRNGLIPCCAIATVGTTGTLAVDPVREIGEICEKYGIWLHVDAAYAGSALLLPEYRWMGEGIGKADSFVFNPHKWLFTNFDCSAYFVRDAGALIRTFGILPEYLRTSTRGLVNDYRDWGIQLGRRFRALKLWFVMRSYGISGLQEKLRKHIRLNELFAERLRNEAWFEIIGQPFLNFTCFRYHPRDTDVDVTLNELNASLLEKVNRTGKIFLSHTKIGEMFVLRFVIGQTYVEQKHMDFAFEAIREAAGRIDAERLFTNDQRSFTKHGDA